MSQENVEIVLGLLPANEKSPDEFHPYLDPEFEIIPTASFPDREIFRGPSGFERWATRWTSMFDEHELTVGRTWDAGDHVVVELSERVRSRGSSFSLEDHYAHVWTFQDGVAIRLEIFEQLDDALAAAGVRN